MKKSLILLLTITILSVCFASYGNQESIIICSSMDQLRNEELQNQLNKKFPDQNIIVTYMPTGKAAAKIFTEGEGTEIDIILAMESGYLSKLDDCLSDISGISRISYLPGLSAADNHNKWVTWEKFAGAIIVNDDVLKKYGLEAPKDYKDLLKPEYKGLIAMPDPKSSGTGYFFLKSWVNSMGEKAAFHYVDQLHQNLKQFTESGNGPTNMLKQGEIAIGLGMTFQAVQEINSGVPLRIIFPESGSPYSLSGTAMIRNREKDPQITMIYDFLVNDFLIYDKENFSPEAIYENQINKVPNYPKNIKYANMSGIQDSKEKERLLSLWKY